MILEVQGLETFYGQAQALFGVSLTIGKGQAISLMGRNGMGKSTTIRSICQLTPPAKGTVIFDGNDITKMPAYKVARAGIGLVPEGRRCFSNLSVLENMMVTAKPGKWTLNKAMNFFPKLGERAGQMASTLSGGEQQMLAIARALMTNPKLLILDEATEGLAPLVRKEIWHAIHRFKDEGLSLLIVDKIISELLPISDKCYILQKGYNVWQGKPSEVTEDIQSHYLGV